MLNEAFDNTRKAEQIDRKLLNGHRFTLLHKKFNLSEKKIMELETFLLTYPVLGEAYKYKEGFLDAFTFEKNNEAVVYVSKWCKSVVTTQVKVVWSCTHFRENSSRFMQCTARSQATCGTLHFR